MSSQLPSNSINILALFPTSLAIFFCNFSVRSSAKLLRRASPQPAVDNDPDDGAWTTLPIDGCCLGSQDNSRAVPRALVEACASFLALALGFLHAIAPGKHSVPRTKDFIFSVLGFLGSQEPFVEEFFLRDRSGFGLDGQPFCEGLCAFPPKVDGVPVFAVVEFFCPRWLSAKCPLCWGVPSHTFDLVL